jgi:prepilin-type N-terminal cleavage/methylation domain-containing protein
MQKIRKNGMWRRQQGFSLVELAVTIAIAAVIAAIVIPGLLGMRQRYQLRSSATDVMSAVKRAQTEAVKRGSRVALLLDTAAGTCTVFADDGTGVGGVASNLIQDGTEQRLFMTTVQTGNTLQAIVTFPVAPNPPYSATTFVTEFNSGGIPTSAGSVNIVSGAGLTVQYQVAVNVTGHVNLLTSTDSGATFH